MIFARFQRMAYRRVPFYALPMRVLAERHQAAARELWEWWEDLWQRGISSQIVLLKVPPEWGRSAVLNQLAQTVASSEDGPVTLGLRVNCRELPDGPGLQAEVLRDLLTDAGARHRVAELLGLDRLAGGVQLGVGVGGLFVSDFAAALGFLVAGMAVGAAGKVWDDSPAGQSGAVARAARSVAEVSASVPVVVLVDDADCLDPDLAVVMLENLVFRADGHLLAVATLDPDGWLAAALTSGDRYSLFGCVHTVDADPDMSYQSRAALAQELCSALPDAALRRIAQRTQTFADVFAVASAERLAELRPGDDQASALAVADAVIDARLTRPAPTAEAVMVAWAGGSVHAQQADRALAVLGAGSAADDPGIVRAGALVRLADPASPRLGAPVAQCQLMSGRRWRQSSWMKPSGSARTQQRHWWTGSWPRGPRTGYVATSPSTTMAVSSGCSARWFWVWRAWAISPPPLPPRARHCASASSARSIGRTGRN